MAAIFTLEQAARRKELYELGLNDRQIAREMVCSRLSVQNWRHKWGLPANTETGVPMEEALPPNGCDIVRSFLGRLFALDRERRKRERSQWGEGTVLYLSGVFDDEREAAEWPAGEADM